MKSTYFIFHNSNIIKAFKDQSTDEKVFGFLLSYQGQSIDYALRYGYLVEVLSQETGITTDYKTGKIIERPEHEGTAAGLIRKLADVRAKDLSPETINEAFEFVVMPKVCKERTVLLIDAGIITMEKVNKMIAEDDEDRRKCQEQEAGQTHLYKFSFTGRPVDAIGKLFKISAEYRAADIKTAINTLYDSYEHITEMKATKNGVPISIEI